MKQFMQFLFGYTVFACYGRVEQMKFFWTARDAAEWMQLYPHGSSVLVLKRRRPVAFRRTEWRA